MLREQFVQHRDHKLMSIALTSAADRRTRWITIPRSCIKLPDIYRCLVLLPLWTCQSGFKFLCCKQTRFIKAILIYRLQLLSFLGQLYLTWRNFFTLLSLNGSSLRVLYIQYKQKRWRDQSLGTPKWSSNKSSRPFSNKASNDIIAAGCGCPIREPSMPQLPFQSTPSTPPTYLDKTVAVIWSYPTVPVILVHSTAQRHPIAHSSPIEFQKSIRIKYQVLLKNNSSILTSICVYSEKVDFVHGRFFQRGSGNRRPGL